MMAMDIYSEKNESAKIAEYGDKAIAKDPDNVSGTVRVSRNYSAEKTNLAKAVEYAEKAKSILGGMRISRRRRADRRAVEAVAGCKCSVRGPVCVLRQDAAGRISK